MKNIIVGTAGHVDHGKTCLIRALTGTDTDRLKEEQKRGITIENGFADMVCGDYNISIIDVPGHEKFIRNMLAGIGGIDMVLLVVALDEGVMPQTVEHLHILDMLGIRRGIIIFTKKDMVDDEDWIQLVEEDTRELVKGTFLEGAPSIEVAAFEGYHIEELKQLIVSQIDDALLKNNAEELFRLPIDRVFTIQGYGTVITGTLIEGTIQKGDEVEIFPEDRKVKVRNVQVHNESVDAAFAGQRTALNLAGIGKEELNRGDVLAYPDSLEPSMMADVYLELFDDIEYEVLNNSRVHFYCGSTEVIGKVVLLDRDAAEPGDSCYAQIRFENEVAFKREDRFIVRFYSPVITIGGGRILDAHPAKHKRNRDSVIHALDIKDHGEIGEIAEQYILEGSAQLLTEPVLAARLRIGQEQCHAIVQDLIEKGRVQLVGKYLMHEVYLKGAFEAGEEILAAFHKENPLTPGMLKEEFYSRLMKDLRIEDKQAGQGIGRCMLDAGKIREAANAIALSDFQIQFTPEMNQIRERMKRVYHEAGYEMPTQDQVLKEEADPKLARHVLDAMAGSGELVRLDGQNLMDPEYYQKALDGMTEIVDRQGQITLAEFRDLIHASRKYAMFILEYWDRQHITVKIGDARVRG
ncbi:MAG: selenocysteine-specific translation elongation factor [Clostridiales bacterium]|jgi:selenocysteine-specific elongation factor|nr:selenocysteine-specific translation elongation factor [Clostridiales bacterium]